ncbi:L10-interacting MYB domain-containing protein-like [Magnolia sinica]|uniref:L10-interacting MYB domain-containing protein-like n=1 Tax=Magnolia sinica TaxID=86752 RepID=UPI002657FE66|nr:L10-interacting MYB domain-containing protein-like [Magnolia sinica]XP_058071599.1 L10-interacting MYB domain-containing protein-like [Magnolia sinica]XP_058071601.1 L10-interacting MYB domain-containing protein-like [Magnolia sinica]
MYELTPDSQEHAKAEWTPEHDAFIVKQLLEQERRGNRNEKGFKKAAWKAVVNIFNKKFRVQFNRQQMKSRMNVLKKDYRILKAILNESGFSWDRTSLTVTAIDEVWDDYVLTHPDTEKFRKISLPHYGDLCQLFEYSYAEGKKQPSIVRPNLSENGASADVTTIPVMEQPARTPPTLEEDNKGSISNSEKAVPSRSSECNEWLAMSGVARREKRMRLNVGNRIVDCMQSLVLQSEQLNSPKREPTTNEDSYYKCLEELQELEGLDQSEVLRAVDILKDSMNRVAFWALKADILLEWLKVRCHKF